MSTGVTTSVKNQIRLITFCNTKKRNALSPDDYQRISEYLNSDANNDDIKGTIFTGIGEYFSSGNSLAVKVDNDIEHDIMRFWQQFNQMIAALINYPKLIVVVVNGPAIGIGFTIIGLADIVYASDTATFSAPFVKLGLCAEACSSYLMPRILGRSKASEVILLGRKLNAQEALTYKLISKIIPSAQIPQFIDELADEMSALPMEQIVMNKKLITDHLTPNLLVAAKREAEVLDKCQRSDYFLNNVINFMTQRSKL